MLAKLVGVPCSGCECEPFEGDAGHAVESCAHTREEVGQECRLMARLLPVTAGDEPFYDIDPRNGDLTPGGRSGLRCGRDPAAAKLFGPGGLPEGIRDSCKAGHRVGEIRAGPIRHALLLVQQAAALALSVEVEHPA